MGDIYLSHSAKGYQKPNHKYFKREWRNGRWYYYYNKKDYAKFKTDEANETKKFADEYNDLIKDDEYQARQLNRASVSGNRNQVFSLGKNPYIGTSNGWVKGGGSAKTKRDYALEADYHSRMAKNLKKERDNNYRVAENAARDAARAVTSSKSYKLKTKANAYKNKVGRNILKGKKKVAELLDRLQKRYESEKRRYEGKKAGRKSAKLSKERQKRHKQNNTIKLNNKQRVTFSEVKLGRRK